MSTAASKRHQRLSAERNADWLRAERARRRVAFTKSRQQRRDGIDALARAGLHPVALPSLDEAFNEHDPRCLY